MNLRVIDAGRFRLDGGAMFGRVPKVLWEKHIPADEKNRIPMATRLLLLETDDKKILVDAGLGAKLSEKHREIFAVEEKLLPELANAGVHPREITHVLLTHLHFDHCGGATFRDADGKISPTFPNATHLVDAEHWKWAHDARAEFERPSFVPENYEMLREKGRLKLLGDGEQPLNELHLHTFFGHTKSLRLPIFSLARGKKVFFAGDLVQTAAHVRVVWVPSYDIEPMKTLAEKREILAKAADERWGLFLEHDAANELVTVRRDGDDFAVAERMTLEEFLAK
jgi:glyoxylase-like metal-dependent hydrolase (beta-lactamase superfamily II)